MRSVVNTGCAVLIIMLACVIACKRSEQRSTKFGESRADAKKTDLDPDSIQPYLDLLSGNPMTVGDAIRDIDAGWNEGSGTMLLEAARMSRSKDVLQQAVWLLQKKTGKDIDLDFRAWLKYLWIQEYRPHTRYPELKAKLYSVVDPRFDEYFQQTETALVRLDEVVWGGVKRDGIPPLKNPKMIAADEADYLGDTDVVFGIELNGDVRCYPNRILAWHEMFKDTIGGESVCGVY